MRLLLDTHALLWFDGGDRRLSGAARRALEAEDARLHISAATVWEMALKSSLGRLTLPGPLEQYVAEKLEEGYRVISVEWTHAAAIERMPFHHRDPFDRLIVAHALAEGMPVVTRDRVFRKYGVNVIW